MTAFDGLREHWEPLSVTAPRRRRALRRVWRVIDGALFVVAVCCWAALAVIAAKVLLP